MASDAQLLQIMRLGFSDDEIANMSDSEIQAAISKGGQGPGVAPEEELSKFGLPKPIALQIPIVTRKQVDQFRKSGLIGEGRGDFSSRAQVGIQANQEARESVMTELFGAPRVRKIEDTGKFLVLDPETEQFIEFDPESEGFFDLLNDPADIPGDIADVSRDVIVGAISTLTPSKLGFIRRALTGGGSSVAGVAAADAIAARTPGGKAQGQDELLKEMGLAGLFGVLGEGFGQGVTAAAKAWRSRLGNRMLAEVAQGSGGKTGRELATDRVLDATEAGVRLNLRQATGSQVGADMQRLLSEDSALRAIFDERRLGQLQELRGSLGKAVRRVASDEAPSPSKAAFTIGSAWKVYNDVVMLEQGQSFKAFLKAAEKASGGKAVLPARNLLAAVDNIAATSDNPALEGATRATINKTSLLRKMLLGMAKNQGGEPRLTVKQLQDAISSHLDIVDNGFAANTVSPADERISKELVAAMQNDLADAVDAGVPGARDLLDARANHADIAAGLRSDKSDVVGAALKAINKSAPDSFAEADVSKFSADQLSQAVRLFKRMPDSLGSEALVDLRRAFLERGLSGAEDVVRPGDKLSDISLDEFVGWAVKNKRKIDAVNADTPKMRLFMDRIFNTAKVILDEEVAAPLTPREIGVTAPVPGFRWFRTRIPVGSTFDRIGLLWKQLAHGFSSRRHFVDVLSDPEQAKLFLGIVKPPVNQGAEKTLSLAARLLGIMTTNAKERGYQTPQELLLEEQQKGFIDQQNADRAEAIQQELADTPQLGGF